MINLLFLCPKKIYDTKMSRVRFHAVDAIGRNPNVKLTQYFPEDGEDITKIVESVKPQFILWYKPMDMVGYNKVSDKIVKIISYNEMYNREVTIREVQLSKSHLIICHHQNDYEWFVQNYNTFFTNAPNLNKFSFKVMFVNIPHSAEKTVYKDYGLEKIYDVLMVGRTTPKHYPFKNRLTKLIESRISKIHKCHIFEHPGYNVPNFKSHAHCLEGYAKIINQAKVVLSCTSRYKYFLGKLVEIPMCNSLVCSDYPDERHDFCKKFIWEINDKMGDDEIVNRVTMILNNKEKLKEMTMAGKMLMDANFTQEHYALKFLNVIGKYYGKR